MDPVTSPTGEQAIVSALRRLAQDTEVPPADPQTERVLLEAFDVAWQQGEHPLVHASGGRPLLQRCSRWRQPSRG